MPWKQTSAVEPDTSKEVLIELVTETSKNPDDLEASKRGMLTDGKMPTHPVGFPVLLSNQNRVLQIENSN